jgi:hypothetical protein
MTLAVSKHTVPSGAFHSWRAPAYFRIDWNAENQPTKVLNDASTGHRPCGVAHSGVGDSWAGSPVRGCLSSSG